MDKNSLSVACDLSGYYLEPARLEHIHILFDWFRDAALFEQWAGPRLLYPHTAEALHRGLSDAGYQLFALHNSSNHMVGFGQIQLLPDRLHLARLAVHPEYRGKKLSHKLMNHLIFKAESIAEFSIVSLFVYEQNTIARKSYQKYGFSEKPWPSGTTKADSCLFMTMAHEAQSPSLLL